MVAGCSDDTTGPETGEISAEARSAAVERTSEVLESADLAVIKTVDDPGPIVGQVVTLRDKLAWKEKLPLFGQTVLVTRTRQQASKLSGQLIGCGAAVIECPTIEIAPPEDLSPLDAALAGLGERELAMLRRRELGFVFQQYNLFQNMNVLDNVMAPGLAISGGAGGEVRGRSRSKP